MAHSTDPDGPKVLICDLMGLRLGADGQPDCSELRAHVQARGAVFHDAPTRAGDVAADPRVQFFYHPDLNTADDLLAEAGGGAYDAVIAAATVIPEGAVFAGGGVRIGAGTGNMQSASWGGASGVGGTAPLMNTPGLNSRATAQMVLKAILRVWPDLPFDALHDRCVAGDFDTGRDLWRYPTEKLEGRRMAVLGYGNIGREVARLAAAFGMTPVVHARPRHRAAIEAEGYVYAPTPLAAAQGADLLSVHVGLGAQDPATGTHGNAGLVEAEVLNAMAPGAMLVNFDRGEVVQADALDAALTSGQIAHAAIDADLFTDPDTGALSGPLVPFLDLAKRHAGRILLLPHAVADTDHPTRVAGAKQAVDQILGALLDRTVAHVKGDIPPGYRAVAGASVKGIGGVTAHDLAALAGDADALARLRDSAGRAHAFLQRLDQTGGEQPRLKLCEAEGTKVMHDLNTLAALMRQLGLHGPFMPDNSA